MNTVLALVVGGLYAAGVYMMMRRSIVKLLIGLALLGHAANLLIFTSAGLTRGAAPIVPEGAARAGEIVADPVPQALVLTAIVIGFAVLAFAVALIVRVRATTGTDDVDRLRETDR